MACPKYGAIQEEVRRASRLVKVHVAAPAVVGGQVKHGVDARNRLTRDFRVQEVGLRELDRAGVDVALEVGQLSTAQVVHDTHPRAGRDQRVDQVRADERRAAGDQHRPAGKGLRSAFR